nr:leaf rust 10 disease-resistance locus receptor-like protein kinase-like 1.2 [Tanacetum cinerariifolium]
MAQNEYKVKDIMYEKKRVRLENTVLTRSSQNCASLDIRNFTIGWQFSIVNHTTRNILLMSNCSGSSSSNLDPGMDIYRVGPIGSCEKNTTKYAMLEKDANLRNMTGRCGVVVEARVELSGGEGWRVNGTIYGEVMERGFELTWRAPDCGECAKSGGRCGFNATAIRFVCFCPDRPHSESCKPDPLCGHPRFEVQCNSSIGSAVINLSQNEYKVKDIDYKEKKVRLENTATLTFTENSQKCVNLDIRNFTTGWRWSINNHTTQNLVLMSNCSGNTSSGMDIYRVRSCEKDSIKYAMLKNDTNFSNMTGRCSVVVEAPVEVSGDEGWRVDGTNYGEVLERGFELTWQATDCCECAKSGGRCGYNATALRFVCFCTDRPHSRSCKPANRNHTVIILSVVLGTAVFLAFAAAIFITRRVYKRRAFTYFSSKDKSRDLEDASVYFGVSVFSYTELEDATNHFDSSKELGDGGFGTVYYGKLRDGREVAVKRLYEHNYKRVQQFMNEVEILTRLRHQNLVSLYGCTSRKSRELLLVYEYISNGTVADHLHGDRAKPSRLVWQTRIKIAIETASALVYLHASEIIHRDVKTNNILLDENFCVKVADFGLSRLLPNDVTHVSTAPQGTPGYVDPEYHQCYQLTDKSDVYSFGVVLIELISSMPAIDISRSREEISLANMALNRIQKCALDDLIDPFLGSDPNTERMTTSVAELAFRCLQFDSETRPTMVEVLEVLKGIQVEESGDDVNTIKSELPPASPETEHSGLLKGRVAASPISVTAKWHSTSSELSTPSTNNGKEFSDNPFKDWCDKLNITQRFASVKHPQSNGLVERANRSLGEGIKSRLGEGNKNWVEELPHVLWAYRTMIKSSHGDTPFSLTYETEAVIPTEIEMPTYRTAAVDMVSNDEELRLNLDLLEERRERAAICKAKAKSKMTKYYNARDRGVAFKPGDFVYRSNDASHAVAGGKLGPKWEGPYEVTETLGNGAYKLRSMDGTILPRTWNIANLKRCYL